ncbi:hypothetical protein HC928_07815 [bacterium]|nr:hypothetical protein [bacterium]
MPVAQILGPAPSFGSQLGQALGSGLGEGLQNSLSSFYKEKQADKTAQSQMPIVKSLLAEAGMDIADEDILSFLKTGGKFENISPFVSKIHESQQKKNRKKVKKLLEKSNKKKMNQKNNIKLLSILQEH